MNICLLVPWGDSLTYTLAKALAFNGHQVTVSVANSERHNNAIWGVPQRISAIPGVTVVSDADFTPSGRIDLLVMLSIRQLLVHCRNLEKLAYVASQISVISSGDRSRPYKQALRLQWQEVRWLWRFFGKVKRIAYKDGYYPIDLLGIFKSRRIVGFDAHSKFLHDEALFQAIHIQDWESDTLRPIRANFLGSRDPEIRRHILEQVESHFSAIPSSGKQSKKMLWHAYTDEKPNALSPEAFLGALSDSDFTLSPPGYSLITHRPIEGLLRGSIPVLNAEELDLYGLGLVDGVNCIAVSAGAWSTAIERITSMNESEIIAMRRHIQSMFTEHLDYPALSRSICQRLGLTMPKAEQRDCKY